MKHFASSSLDANTTMSAGNSSLSCTTSKSPATMSFQATFVSWPSRSTCCVTQSTHTQSQATSPGSRDAARHIINATKQAPSISKRETTLQIDAERPYTTTTKRQFRPNKRPQLAHYYVKTTACYKAATPKASPFKKSHRGNTIVHEMIGTVALVILNALLEHRDHQDNSKRCNRSVRIRGTELGGNLARAQRQRIKPTQRPQILQHRPVLAEWRLGGSSSWPQRGKTQTASLVQSCAG